MSARSGLIVILALLFGGSAAMGVNKYVMRDPEGTARSMDTVPVVVAAEDIPRGSSLTASLVKIRDFPRGLQPPGTLARIEDALERAVFIPLVKGEPVLDGKLAAKGAKRGMAALVPSGFRAFTIHTPSVASGVAGFVLPGNKVDLLLTVDGKRGSVTSTILQNLEILAVDQRIDAPADNRVDPRELRSVTLLVTPDQAAKLSLAQNKGALQLSLRNPQDVLLAKTSPARLSEFEGYREEAQPPRAAAAAESRPAPKVVTIYRVGQAVERRRLGTGPTTPAMTEAISEEVMIAGSR